MKLSIQYKILNTKNYYQYLKENSFFIKELSRSEFNYKLFNEYVKNKYTLRVSDKINKTIENVENVSNLLNMLK